jgi:hypothetical protein
VKATDFSDCEIQGSIDSAAAPFDPEENATVQIVGGPMAPDGCTDATQGEDVQVSWDQPLEINIPFWSNVTVTSNIKAVFRCE